MQAAGVLGPGLQVVKTMKERRALYEREQLDHKIEWRREQDLLTMTQPTSVHAPYAVQPHSHCCTWRRRKEMAM